MRIQIGEGQAYDLHSVDDLTLAQLIRLEKECAALGQAMKWRDLRAMLERIAAMDADKAQDDDDFLLFIGITVWASRLAAGETVSLADAVAFRLADLEFLPDEGEELPADEPADPPLPRPERSGRGAAKAKAAKRA